MMGGHKLPRSNCPRQNVAQNSLNKCCGLYALNQDARHYALHSTTNKTNCVKHTDVRTNVKAERTGQGKNGPEITVWNIGLVVRVGRNGQLIKERGGENDHIGQTKKRRISAITDADNASKTLISSQCLVTTEMT